MRRRKRTLPQWQFASYQIRLLDLEAVHYLGVTSVILCLGSAGVVQSACGRRRTYTDQIFDYKYTALAVY